jgi:hypothetical protein
MAASVASPTLPEDPAAPKSLGSGLRDTASTEAASTETESPDTTPRQIAAGPMLPRKPKRPVWRGAILRLGLFVCLLLLADRMVAAVLRHGLDKYFSIDRNAVVLCVGHSRTVLGIDDALLERELQVPVAKYAVNGADTQDRLAMIRQYLDHHDSVKVLVYDVSAFTFTDKGLSSNSYKLFYPYLDDSDMGAHIRLNAESHAEVIWRQIFATARFDEVTLSLAMRGYSGLRANLKIGAVDIAATQDRINHGETRSMEIDPENVALFQQTLDFAHSRGVHVVLVYIPTLDILSNSNRPQHEKVIALLKQIAAAHDGVTFVDYNSDLESHHELFFDPIHMNSAGQAVVSKRLAGDLSKLLGGNAAGADPSASAEK